MSPYHFTAPLECMESPLWTYHILVDEAIAKALLDDGHKRVVATLNDQEKSHCALMSKGDGRHYILINKELRKKLSIATGDPVDVQLKPDTSKYGMPMPPELGELLHQDPEGNRVFHALSPGKQRNLIHIVGKYKQSTTRLRKAIVIVDYLIATGGKLDFKELNEAFKQR